jgi:hypothetical protein
VTAELTTNTHKHKLSGLWIVCSAAGLAATLGLIKDKGLLKDKTQWAGRNNDKKPVALIGLEDVYTGGLGFCGGGVGG